MYLSSRPVQEELYAFIVIAVREFMAGRAALIAIVDRLWIVQFVHGRL